MSNRKFGSIAAIGASAVVSIGALTFSIAQGHSDNINNMGSGMSTGATMTESADPASPPIEEAKPAIKGPAPLPKEEQGLPG